MELTKKQEEGLKIILQRYKDHQKYTVISVLNDDNYYFYYCIQSSKTFISFYRYYIFRRISWQIKTLDKSSEGYNNIFK